jgi:hypothetical protein
MSETQITTHGSVNSAPATRLSIADTIVDFGLLWADKGLGFSKTALENGARKLDRTAKYLEDVQGRLKGAPPSKAAA